MKNKDISPKEFQKLFKAYVDRYNKSYEDLAREFSVSKPVADRWMNGKTCPAPGYRQILVRHIIEEAEKMENLK